MTTGSDHRSGAGQRWPAFGRPGVAGAVEIHHGLHQPDHLAQAGGVLPTRHGRLRAEVPARVGQATAGQLDAGIPTQVVEVVGILVATGDRQDPRPQDVGQRMDHPRRVAWVGDQRRQPVAETELALGRGQQQHAAIRGQPTVIEGGGHLLAADRWKAKGLDRIVIHGGCGAA